MVSAKPPFFAFSAITNKTVIFQIVQNGNLFYLKKNTPRNTILIIPKHMNRILLNQEDLQHRLKITEPGNRVMITPIKKTLIDSL